MTDSDYLMFLVLIDQASSFNKELSTSLVIIAPAHSGGETQEMRSKNLNDWLEL